MTLLCAARCRTDTPREAAPGYRLCWPCRDWLGRNLRTVVELTPDLEAAMAKGQAMGERVDTSPTPSLPFNLAAAAARYQLHRDLVGTVRIVIEERGLVVFPADDIGAMAVWLGRHVDWLSAHGSAGERATEAADWVSLMRRAINPNPSKIVHIGTCPFLGCTGTLTAVVRPQDSMLPSAITCSWWAEQEPTEDALPHAWRADQWHALARHMARSTTVRRFTVTA